MYFFFNHVDKKNQIYQTYGHVGTMVQRLSAMVACSMHFRRSGSFLFNHHSVKIETKYKKISTINFTTHLKLYYIEYANNILNCIIVNYQKRKQVFKKIDLSYPPYGYKRPTSKQDMTNYIIIIPYVLLQYIVMKRGYVCVW